MNLSVGGNWLMVIILLFAIDESHRLLPRFVPARMFSLTAIFTFRNVSKNVSDMRQIVGKLRRFSFTLG